MPTQPPSEPDYIDGTHLATIRKKDGQTQQQLATAAGISVSYLCDIEKGRRDAKPEVLARLAAALNVPKSLIEKRQAIAS